MLMGGFEIESVRMSPDTVCPVRLNSQIPPFAPAVPEPISLGLR